MSSDTHKTEDEDYQFLERVLDKLYDFGSAPKQSQKKKKRKRREDDEEAQTVSQIDYRQEDDDDNAEPHQTDEGPPSQKKNLVEVVTFQDPRKKMKTRPTTESQPTTAHQITEKNQEEPQEELTLEKARLEVHRFGITGYKKEQQRGFEQERAVMLGARPPKKEYLNYKTLQERIREKKQKVKEEVEPELKKKKKPREQKKKKGASPSASGAPSGQVGRFKNGMLVLSSKEIQKIKSKRGK